jgi:hypothetical protein
MMSGVEVFHVPQDILVGRKGVNRFGIYIPDWNKDHELVEKTLKNSLKPGQTTYTWKRLTTMCLHIY